MIFNYNLRNYNFRIVLYMLFLSIAGILVLRSASGGDSSVVGKQIMGVALSFTACIIISFIDYHKIFRFNILIYVGCVVLLIAVLIAGHNSHGATRWLNIFGFTVQEVITFTEYQSFSGSGAGAAVSDLNTMTPGV